MSSPLQLGIVEGAADLAASFRCAQQTSIEHFFFLVSNQRQFKAAHLSLMGVDLHVDPIVRTGAHAAHQIAQTSFLIADEAIGRAAWDDGDG